MMDDLISRQEALNIRFSDAINEDGVLYVPLRDFIDGLKALPSAQPLTAYVISDEDGNIKCSNCGSFECWGNYCMDCGAKMRGES